MPIRQYKPTTPSRRYMTVVTGEEVSKKKPEKALLVRLVKSGGRNSTGRITSRFMVCSALRAVSKANR